MITVRRIVATGLLSTYGVGVPIIEMIEPPESKQNAPTPINKHIVHKLIARITPTVPEKNFPNVSITTSLPNDIFYLIESSGSVNKIDPVFFF